MSIQTETNKLKDPVSSTSPSTAKADSSSAPVTIGQLLSLLSQAQVSFGELQQVLATSGSEVTEENGVKTYRSFSQIQGEALIKAANKAMEDLAHAIEAQKKAEKKGSIFKWLTLSLTAIVTVIAVITSAGAASALIPLVMLAMSSVSASGGKDLFQLAAQGLQKILPPGPANELMATIIVAVVVTALSGGASSALVGVECGSQTLLDTGLPKELAGFTSNEDAKKWIEAITYVAIAVTMISAGVKISKQNSAENGAMSYLTKLSTAQGWNTATIHQITQGIQLVTQLVSGSFGIATGAAVLDSAEATYDARTNQALITQLNALIDIALGGGKGTQEDITNKISEINKEMADISDTAGTEYAALAQQSI